MADKLKLGFYWAASCGGCEIAVLEIYEKILTLAEHADILFWPVAMDAKYKDVEAMPDKHLDFCLFNGAVRNSESEHMAKLLREKSKILIAYGSCATEGCIPALANLSDREGIFKCVYEETVTTHNPAKVIPLTNTQVEEGELVLPQFYNTVYTLADVVEVDYFIPGCPPVPEQTWAVLESIIQRKPLPPKGSYIGCGDKTVCDECPRKKGEKKITKLHRIHEVEHDPEICFLEQGIFCAGPATRSGCDARCLRANMPCRGCYGAPDGVIDQGAKILSALASVIDEEKPEKIKKIIDELPDTVGYFYRFSLAHSLMKRAKKNGDNSNINNQDEG